MLLHLGVFTGGAQSTLAALADARIALDNISTPDTEKSEFTRDITNGQWAYPASEARVSD